MKKIFLFFPILILGLFLLPKFSFADQTDFSSSFSLTSQGVVHPLATFFLGSQAPSTINSVTVMWDNATSTNPPFTGLQFDEFSGSGMSGNQCSGSYITTIVSGVSSVVTSTYSGNLIWTSTLGAPLSVIAGDCYDYQLSYNNSVGNVGSATGFPSGWGEAVYAGGSGGPYYPPFTLWNYGGAPSSTATISFSYPVNSSTTPPFTDYLLHVGGYGTLPPPLWLTVSAGLQSSTFPYFLSQQLLNPGSSSIQTLSVGYALQNYLFLSNLSSSVFYANAYLSSGVPGVVSSTLVGFGSVYASSSISFTMISSSTFIQTGGGLAYLTPLIASSSQQTCQSGNILADGLCIFLVGAFTPQTPATQYFQSGQAALLAAPPFSQITQTFSTLQNDVSSSPAGADFIDPYFNFGSAASSTPNFVILGSTTLSQAVTPAGKNLLFQVEDAVFELLDLGLIFFVPWHWWRKKHHSQVVQK